MSRSDLGLIIIAKYYSRDFVDQASARKRLELTSEHFMAAMDSFLRHSGIIMATSVYLDPRSIYSDAISVCELMHRKPKTWDAP